MRGVSLAFFIEAYTQVYWSRPEYLARFAAGMARRIVLLAQSKTDLQQVPSSEEKHECERAEDERGYKE